MTSEPGIWHPVTLTDGHYRLGATLLQEKDSLRVQFPADLPGSDKETVGEFQLSADGKAQLVVVPGALHPAVFSIDGWLARFDGSRGRWS